jgi:hypothetical protein
MRYEGLSAVAFYVLTVRQLNTRASDQPDKQSIRGPRQFRFNFDCYECYHAAGKHCSHLYSHICVVKSNANMNLYVSKLQNFISSDI